MLGKNRRNNVQKRFLYSHGYRDQKRGEKTRGTIFPETHELCGQKCWEKDRREKMRKNFFIFTRIS